MRSKQAGMSLMELLVVVVIIGVLVSIAYPSYRQQVIKSYRTEARTSLLQAAQKLERCFTRTSTYANCFQMIPFMSEHGHYQIAFDAANTDFDRDMYQLTATPQGGQAADTRCNVLSIDNANRKTATGPLGNVACWE